MPKLGELNTFYKISRGEEGSKFLLEEKSDGDFMMVIPRDVGRYSLQPGIKIKINSLDVNKIKNFYSFSKIWIIRCSVPEFLS